MAHPSNRCASCSAASSHSFSFFFNDTAPTEIYTLSLHDALPISRASDSEIAWYAARLPRAAGPVLDVMARSEEHTSELQSPYDLVCRLLLEKKKAQRHMYCPPGLGHLDHAVRGEPTPSARGADDR